MKRDNENQNINSMLERAIADYLLWMIDKGSSKSSWYNYDRVLKCFYKYISRQTITWELIFIHDTLADFRKECQLTNVETAVRGLSRYLFEQNRISSPLSKQKKKGLPIIYEEYLTY